MNWCKWGFHDTFIISEARDNGYTLATNKVCLRCGKIWDENAKRLAMHGEYVYECAEIQNIFNRGSHVLRKNKAMNLWNKHMIDKRKG